MGITTVAVFSDADENAPFVKSADRAVRIGPAPSSESYLRVEKIVEAARRTGANAIHPGFGFLAENAGFAEACAEAGILFVGPSPRAIRDMGLKREAKEIVSKAGVPVIPGGSAQDQSVKGLCAEARGIGFPVLVKASAGGGGKGMRVVRAEGELEAAIEGAKREAKSSFGNDTLLIEKYIERPRHVEVQILGDSHGNVVHLFERECSIQRRHQKIIEETPSVALNAALRAEMGAAAVAVGKAVDYQSAGTVEFILGPDGKFYFLEVNTRLQVEHPITEAVTGVDIVREQILVAQGAELSFRQEDLRMSGAAIECRLYAEDADNGFLPTTGTVVDFHVPSMPDLRVDTGIEVRHGDRNPLRPDDREGGDLGAVARQKRFRRCAALCPSSACRVWSPIEPFCCGCCRTPSSARETPTLTSSTSTWRESFDDPDAAAAETLGAIAVMLAGRKQRRAGGNCCTASCRAFATTASARSGWSCEPARMSSGWSTRRARPMP